MPQKINSAQMSLNINGVVYPNCFIKSGSVVQAVGAGADADFNIDTGVAKFPNGILARGTHPGWTTVTWNHIIRACYIYQDAGNANIRLNCHIYATAGISKTIYWWAIGY